MMQASSRLGHMVYEKNDKNGVIVLGIFEEKRIPSSSRGARESTYISVHIVDSQWRATRATALDAALRRL